MGEGKPPKSPKNMEDTKKFISMVANKQGWKLNPDESFIDLLVEGLTTNFNRYGYYLCPCRDGTGIRDKDKDLICPCEYCRPDQQEYGHCFCGLYLTPQFFATGRKPRTIPERRPADKGEYAREV